MEDPSTGETLVEVADGQPEDALEALAAAAERAGRMGGAPRPRERGEILRRAYELVREQADELALVMTLEMGKALAESQRGDLCTPPSSCAGSPRRPSASTAATWSTRPARGGS